MSHIQCSINLSEIARIIKTATELQHKSEKTSDIYTNIVVWINANADNFGYDCSIQISLPKDFDKTKLKTTYVGNGKTDTLIKEVAEKKEKERAKMESKPKIETAIQIDGENVTITADDLPF